jgi:hypothetical protein
MESNSYSACGSSVSSKIAESNQESVYIVDPLQHDHTNLAKVLGHTDNATSKASADARLDSLKGYKSQNSQPPKEVIVEHPWTKATVDPFDPLQYCADASRILNTNVYRSTTPTDTPELCMSGPPMPTSLNSEIVDLDIFDYDWQSFRLVGVNGLPVFDMNNRNNAEHDSIEPCPTVFDGKQPALNYSPLDDVGDTSAFDKPFTPDTSIFSMSSPPAHSNEGFLTLKQRRTHYQKVHSHLFLTCGVEGCNSRFLRGQDRTKHENRMHSAQKVEEPHTEGPADVNEIAEINHISAGNLFQIRPDSER